MSGHTAGPWNQIAKMNGFTAVGASTLLAKVYSTAFGDHENEAANAQLIAAAPELLAALRWALGRLSDARNVCYGGVTVEEIEEREAVLTKATGK